ncbi:MAG: cheA [Enterovirga sp.]|nr:cheA [Enterovirga sp.]
MDDLLREFLVETGEHLETVDVELVRLERDPTDAAILRNIFRLVHTIKGTCGFLGLPRLEALAHAAETLMGQVREGKPLTKDLVTVALATIDRIKDILRELDRLGAEPAGSDDDLISALERAAETDRCPGLAQAGGHGPVLDGGLLRPLRTDKVPLDVLERAFRETPGPGEPTLAAPAPSPPWPGLEGDTALGRAQTVRVGLDTLEHLIATVSELVLTRNQLLEVARRMGEHEPSLKAPLQRLSQVAAELQDGIMKARMQPVGRAWAKLPRILRDASAELGKSIGLVTRGSETEIDRQVLDMIRDPLLHMIRNAAAHGIELPAERLAAGKPAQGTITIAACQEGGAIAIEITDDGRGLDHEAIRRRAVAMKLASSADAERMSEAQLADLIFHPGFSTTAVADALSGRGVGMDVVKTNVEAIGGAIEIASEAGRGTAFKIKLPLTLAIVPALTVRIAGQRFAIPQVTIQELIRVRPGSDQALEQINGACLLRLGDQLLPVLDLGQMMGVAPAGQRDSGFVVVADLGRVRFGMLVDAVLETEEIVVKPLSARLKHLQLFCGNTILGDGSVALIIDPNGVARRAGADLVHGARHTGRVTPFAAEDGSGATALLVFRGGGSAFKAMPLSLIARLEEMDAGSIEQAAGISSIQYRGRLMPLFAVDQHTQLRREGVQPVIVIAAGDALLGLAIDEVVDIVEERIEIAAVPGRPDLLGTAIVRGRATEIIDVADFLPRAGADGFRHAARSATVLLVDDNAFFRDMLTPVLKAAGYRVRTAASAGEALRSVLGGGIDAVVLDLALPDRPGLDLVEAMRRHAPTAGLPVLALATRPDEILAQRAEALGLVGPISKFDRSGLIAALAHVAAQPERRLAA